MATKTVFSFNSFLIDSGFIRPSSSGTIKETSIFLFFNRNLIGSKIAGCSMLETMMWDKKSRSDFWDRGSSKSDFDFLKDCLWFSACKIPKIARLQDSVPPLVKIISLEQHCKI